MALMRRLATALGLTSQSNRSLPQGKLEDAGAFDRSFYLKANPDVAEAGIDAYQHYLFYGRSEGRHGMPTLNSNAVNEEAAAIEQFDADFYLELYKDVAIAGVDPYEHYLMYGKAEGRIALRPLAGKASGDAAQAFFVHRESFDADFYLESNPDVAVSGADPYEHYIAHGKHEGRVAVRPNLSWRGDFESLDPERETVLVVSHEASRTGAPVLSLNIARELRKRYNVVSMLLRTGSMHAAFSDSSDIVIEPVVGANGVAVAGSLIAQLLTRHKIDFAIVNSIESRGVLPALAKEHVPTITLIHEFAAYTRPRSAFRDAALWSSDMVFSAPVIQQDALDAYPDIAHCVSHILPQGRCVTLASAHEAQDHSIEDARVFRAIRPQSAPDDAIIVLGAGFVQLRKGVDLFLKCAARVMRSVPTRSVRFVWVGKGYDPEGDLEYSVYLADQLRRAGLTEHVSFIGETSSIEAAYSAADLMLISSRLDPLPNVAIDAMAHGMPIICFDQTTGIADVLKINGLGEECVAAYLDASDMADKVLRFIDSDELRKSVGARLQRIVEEQFDLARYVEKLTCLAFAAKGRARQEQTDIADINASELLDVEFMAPPWLKKQPRDLLVLDYVRTWASGVRRRKPFPGFHPGIYQQYLRKNTADPFAEYLRAGRPAGPWRYEIIEASESGNETLLMSLQPRIALHIHVYYPDLLPDIMQRLLANKVRPDLFISVPSDKIAEEVRTLLRAYDGKVVELVVVPNRGRDIGPFLTAFGKVFLADYEIVGHLHTKKTLDISDASMAEIWRRFLLEHLLGGSARMADTILSRMIADSSIGMVCADDPYVVDWGKNRSYANELSTRLELQVLPDHFLFPIGTMFWARSQALRRCFDLNLEWSDYPAEPLPYDGSVLHALERLFGICASTSPYRLFASHVPGFVR